MATRTYAWWDQDDVNTLVDMRFRGFTFTSIGLELRRTSAQCNNKYLTLRAILQRTCKWVGVLQQVQERRALQLLFQAEDYVRHLLNFQSPPMKWREITELVFRACHELHEVASQELWDNDRKESIVRSFVITIMPGRGDLDPTIDREDGSRSRNHAAPNSSSTIQQPSRHLIEEREADYGRGGRNVGPHAHGTYENFDPSQYTPSFTPPNLRLPPIIDSSLSRGQQGIMLPSIASLPIVQRAPRDPNGGL